MHIQKCFRRRSVTNLVTEFVTFYFDKWKYDFFLFSNHQYVKNYIKLIDILFIYNKELRAILFFAFLYRDNWIQFWLASVLRNLNIFFHSQEKHVGRTVINLFLYLIRKLRNISGLSDYIFLSVKLPSLNSSK